jgi:hypothetical protein
MRRFLRPTLRRPLPRRRLPMRTSEAYLVHLTGLEGEKAL